MLKRCLLSALLLPTLLMSPASKGASGAFLNGNKLFEYGKTYHRVDVNSVGTPQENADASFYLGYVTAISDALNSNDLLCLPKNVSGGQPADIVYQYLENNPAERQYTASSNVYVAFHEAFPNSTCK